MCDVDGCSNKSIIIDTINIFMKCEVTKRLCAVAAADVGNGLPTNQLGFDSANKRGLPFNRCATFFASRCSSVFFLLFHEYSKLQQ